MKNTIKDGGPAFGHGAENGHCCGMTMRDYFAGQALMAMAMDKGDNSYDFIAKKCYLYADAMIKAREVTE